VRAAAARLLPTRPGGFGDFGCWLRLTSQERSGSR